jgi:hypothetical protein
MGDPGNTQVTTTYCSLWTGRWWRRRHTHWNYSNEKMRDAIIGAQPRAALADPLCTAISDFKCLLGGARLPSFDSDS